MKPVNDPADAGHIVITGASEHNLRGIDVAIPRQALTVVTGVSGSGKSSLAFATVHAEGQRQYLESLSPYQRRGFDRMTKPKVRSVKGLGPTIAIRQHAPGRNPRSTVGSISEIADHVRLLFSRAGSHTCLDCGADVRPRSGDELIAQVVAAIGMEPLRIRLVERGGSGTLQEQRAEHLADLTAGVGQQTVAVTTRRALAALRGRPDAVLVVEPGNGAEALYLAPSWTCGRCGRATQAVSSQFFNPNSPDGMCRTCEGLGVRLEVTADKLVADPVVSIRAGALSFYGDRRREPKKTYWPVRDVPELLRLFGMTLDTRWQDLPQPLREIILWGTTGATVPQQVADYLPGRVDSGLGPEIDRLSRSAGTAERKDFYQRFMTSRPCHDCGGSRLSAEALAVRLAGCTIAETTARPVAELAQWLDAVGSLPFPTLMAQAVAEIAAEMRPRLAHLVELGLGYLALDRPVTTLSVGECQRLRIARQLGCGLVDVVYVIDEPSVGLHPRDSERLMESLLLLRDAGNTLIVVEHDAAVISSSDHIIDLGPGAGAQGGQVVVAGPPAEVRAHPVSPTGRYLRGEFRNWRGQERRPPDPEAQLVISGARLHNLRGVDASFPLGLLSCVTGPSGSGKSSLVAGVLEPAVAAALAGQPQPQGIVSGLHGQQWIRRVASATQDPMGRSSRSIPATYVGVFDEIRRLYAAVPLAARHGWDASYFSFNSEAGQCLTCRGTGELGMELHFLPDVVVSCPQCRGRRYNDDVSQVRWRGRSIAEILDLDISQAADFFRGHSRITGPLTTLAEFGLGYLRLGQSCSTLSGGEAQRLKLARDLAGAADGGGILYLIDEPTSGLHAGDVSVLIELLHRLVKTGNTVVVIEHNVDVIAAADWVIDLGPGSGGEGGAIVATGTPEDIASSCHSPLAPFLARVLLADGEHQEYAVQPSP